MELKHIIDSFKEKEGGDQKVCSDLKKSKKPILIYGCSDYSKAIYHYLQENEIDIEAFVVDKQYYKNTFLMEEKPVGCIDDYMLEKYNIVVGFGDVEKSRFLRNNQNLLRSKFYFLWNPYGNHDWDQTYVEKNWVSLMAVYKGVSDEISRRTLYELIISKVNRLCNNKLLEVADSSTHYFNELTYSPETRNEIYIDCGAYIGDTIMQYVKFTEL